VVSVASGRLCRAQRWTFSGRRDRWSVWPVGGCAVHSAGHVVAGETDGQCGQLAAVRCTALDM